MRKLIRKLNERAGYIYMPRKYIGREAEVNMIESTRINTPERSVNTKMELAGLDEAERDFIDKIRMNPLRKSVLIQNGRIQFGIKRLEELLKFI